MQPPTRDLALAVPQPHTPPGILSFDAAPLRRTPANDGAFTLAGDLAAVAGRTAVGIDSIEIDGSLVLVDLRVDNATTTAATLTSLGVERTLRTAATSGVTERSAILPALPALVMQWCASATSQYLDVSCCMTIPPDDRPAWNVAAHGVALHTSHGIVACVFPSAPESIEVRPAADGGGLLIFARVRVTAAGTAMYVVRSHTVADMDDTVAALAGVVPLIRSLTAAQKRRARSPFSSPDDALDAAVAWSRQRIPVHASGAPHDSPAAALAAVLAALATGEPAAARTAIDRIAAAPVLLIAIARYFQWTGDVTFVRSLWPRVTTAIMQLRSETGDAGVALRSEALGAIAATAMDMREASLSADLQSYVKQLRTTHAPTLNRTHWLEALPHPAFTPWFRSAVGDDDALLAGMDSAITAAAEAPAAILVPVLYALLGVEPDVPRGRIRIAPRIPVTWDRVELGELAMGDAAVSMRYRRTSAGHEFRFSQDAGGVPLTLIFEPFLPAPPYHSALVDGRPADLQPRPEAGRIVAPVQLVLDEERVVTFELP